MLGIVIGIASVIAMLAIGAGAQKDITDQIEGIGSNLLMVMPGDQKKFWLCSSRRRVSTDINRGRC